MPSIERRTSGIWQVLHDQSPDLNSELVDYERALGEIREIFLPGKYRVIAEQRRSCVEAVNIWLGGFRIILRDYKLGGVGLNFSPAIRDVWGHDEPGQDTLSVYKPGYQTRLVLDVAAYIFGFEHNEIPIAIGTQEVINQAMTEIYTEKVGSSVAVTSYFPEG